MPPFLSSLTRLCQGLYTGFTLTEGKEGSELLFFLTSLLVAQSPTPKRCFLVQHSGKNTDSALR